MMKKLVQAALVIASDVALYSLGDPGEPTQGAGAVAMIIDEPTIAAVSPTSFAFSNPAFDFWRPVGESFHVPSVSSSRGSSVTTPSCSSPPAWASAPASSPARS